MHVRKPDWLKIKIGNNNQFSKTKNDLFSHKLHTICSSGHCPNKGECWSRGVATFMIAGDICTRSCKFCNTKTGKPFSLDNDEPQRIAEVIRSMQLHYVVITSVDRDDLPDFGMNHWIASLEAIRKINKNIQIEALIPDFQGSEELLNQLVLAKPDIVGHNLETVARLTPLVRSKADYMTSLKVLSYLNRHNIVTKTGIMLGLGEQQDEVLRLMDDALNSGCMRLTIGQYLQPSKKHLPVERYVHPDEFLYLKEKALEKGFEKVVSGPLVRSSYHADIDF